MTSKVLFPGSFDPFTRGHADIVERGVQLFGHVVIAVGYNIAKPDAQRDAHLRVQAISQRYQADPRIEVISYACLTTQLAAQVGATAILRGVRSIKDYEYEMQMADVNRQLTGIDTVVLFARPELASVSSSVVRELQHFGVDVSDFI